MNLSQSKGRIKKLKEVINYHRYLYHVKNISEISEEALDSLKDELKKIEDIFPELITEDSPTQRVVGKVLKGFEKVKHKVKQWSFDDAFDLEDLQNWEKRNVNYVEKKSKNSNQKIPIKKFQYFCELKIDGLKIILDYKDGILKNAATRGDGVVGENVTENIKTINSIPLKLEKKVSGIFEGEIYISKKNFNKVNKKQREEGKPEFANPRNLAAGTLRQLDTKIVAQRKLDVFIYDIAEINNMKWKTQKEEIKILSELGFVVNQNNFLAKNLEEVINFYKKQNKKREKYDYWIDGIVLKINNTKIQNELLYTGKAPRFAIALKFPAEQKTTIVKDIIHQVGRTGVITPVALLEDVFIAGTIVGRASLHNADEIERLGLRIGDTVIIEKAGDIIPKVVKVIKDLRTKKLKKYTFPKKVDGCGGDRSVERVTGMVLHRCVNMESNTLKARKISYFVSKKAFDVVEIGPKNIETFIKKGLIKEPEDIFKLKVEDIEVLDGFGIKSANKIVSAINKRHKISLKRFLISLGIDEIGEETAQILSEKFSTFDKIMKLDYNSLIDTNGIGEIVAKKIIEYFKNLENKKMIKNLLLEVKVGKHKKENIKDNYFKDKKVIITGSFEGYSRDSLKEKLRKMGAKNVSSISKNTDILLIGGNPGSKLEKAEKLNIEILNETNLKKYIF